MITRLVTLLRLREVSFLIKLLLISMLVAVPAAFAAPNPPIAQPDTVGDWCRLTAFQPYLESGLVKGKSNFSCSGNTAIEFYETRVLRDHRMSNGAVVNRNFTATGGLTYYATDYEGCIVSASITYEVYTRLIYTDPRNGSRQDIYTTGPWLTKC